MGKSIDKKGTSKKDNGEGSARALKDGSWECIIQSKYLNSKTGNPKRIKRKGKNEREARNNAKMALAAWEKGIEAGRDIKIDKSKTFGEYMEEFIDEEVKPSLTGSGYHSYISNMKNNSWISE